MWLATGNWSLALAVLLCLAAQSGQADDLNLRIDLRGRTVEGNPLWFSSERVILLARDGQLWDFEAKEAGNFSQLPGQFRSHGQAEMRGLLSREFGPRMEVSGTGTYLVVHPAGQKDQWAGRFEELYRSFVHYFTARGYRPQAPPFPLVAVVFARRDDFTRYATNEGFQAGPELIGYYSPQTNRIALYDQTAGDKTKKEWRENAETIIHEAAHQSAFNCGIHSRFAVTPRWVAEGLGTLFEAPGVWNSRQHPLQPDRINRGRLQAVKRWQATRSKGLLGDLISTDRLFEENIDQAYAESWALTFFLSETEPRKYFAYLAKTAARPAFEEYRSPERLRDFSEVFGADLAMLEARYLRFIASLSISK